MRTIVVVIILATFLTGCVGKTEYGQCKGLNGQEDPTLVYEYSAWNMAVGILFLELILPPIDVLLNKLKCPVARAPNSKHE